MLRYACAELDIKLEFSVFLFNWSDKLVVTDIDGTITQSDIKVTVTFPKPKLHPLQIPNTIGKVARNVLPRLGITAHHVGVVELFHKLHECGYKIIYLTAR